MWYPRLPRYKVQLVSTGMNVYHVFRRTGFNRWARIGADTQCLHLVSAQDVIQRDIRERATAPKANHIKAPEPRSQWIYDERGYQI